METEPEHTDEKVPTWARKSIDEMADTIAAPTFDASQRREVRRLASLCLTELSGNREAKGGYVLGSVVLGRAMTRYHTDAEFHAQVETAVQVVLGERESYNRSFRRSAVIVDLATEAAAVALDRALSGGDAE